MIAHILRLIESAIYRIPLQNPLPPAFIKQEEFVFFERDQRLSLLGSYHCLPNRPLCDESIRNIAPRDFQ